MCTYMFLPCNVNIYIYIYIYIYIIISRFINTFPTNIYTLTNVQLQ